MVTLAHTTSRLASTWGLMAKRALAQWRTLSVVIVGMVVASTAAASTAIYFDSLRQLSLDHHLGTYTADQLDILSTLQSGPTSYLEYEEVTDLVRRETDSRLGWLFTGQASAVKTITMALSRPGEEATAGEDDLRAYFAYSPDLDRYTARFAEPRNDAQSEPPVIEVLVPAEAARPLGVQVGDTWSVVPFGDPEQRYARVVVAGLLDRSASDARIWRLYERSLRRGTTLTVRTLPLFLSKEAYFGVMAPALGQVASTYSWLFDVDTGRIGVDRVGQVSSDIRGTEETLGASIGEYRLSTSLPDAIDEYDERLFFAKVPMLVFLVLLMTVVLYFVVTLSSVLAERQRAETALVQSRGATRGHVFTVYALEGATIAVLAVVAGPPLAAVAISLMGLTPAFSDLSGNSLLSVHIPLSAYLMSAAGGFLGFVALMLTALQASRLNVVVQRLRSARPSRLSIFQRYYLDVLVLIAGIVLFRQLSEQGSVLATDMLGGVAANQVLLAAPALVLIAAATILLRLFPIALRLVSGATSRWLPAGPTLALWQMARNPTHYGRVSLLLILMAGLGVFGSGLVATLERSFEERVLYDSGSDIRVEGVDLDSRRLSTDMVEQYESIAAVEIASPVYRGRGRETVGFKAGTFTLLAVDGSSFEKVAWTRDDFADKPLGELLESLGRTDVNEGVVLPPGTATIGVRLKSDRPDPDTQLIVRVRDGNGRYSSYPLGRLGLVDFLGNVQSGGWRDLSESLYAQGRWWVEPLTLVSLGVVGEGGDRRQSGSLLIDRITAGTMQLGTPNFEVVTEEVEPFDGAEGWSILELSPASLSDDLRDAEDTGFVRFTWSGDEAMTSHGIFPGTRQEPLPVLASQSFLTELGYSPGDDVDISIGRRRVEVNLIAAIDFFPTLDPSRERFLVADLEALVRYANLDPLAEELQPNEVWLSLGTGDVDRDRLVSRLARDPFESQRVYDRAAGLAEAKVDPLAKAGWSALMFLGFTVVLVLSGTGLLVHAYVSFQERRPQLAALRSIGLSIRQLVALVWVEQVVVIAVGMALGTWLGGRLVATIMPFLGNDDRGLEIVPPLAVELDWGRLTGVYGIIAVIFFVILVLVAWAASRIALQSALRAGEANS